MKQTVKEMFVDFMNDKPAWDMFITGAAGTGKTTDLAESVQYCEENSIPYVVCAFTHKACGILRSKLMPGARVQTLHSFLGKRPCINTEATKLEHVNQNMKTSEADKEPIVMFLDEWSMVGEKDFMDIREVQDSDYDSTPELKVVWIGDKHQLPPVGDQQTIKPKGNYQYVKTTQYRNDNPLQIPLNKLIAYLDGTEEPAPLESVEGYFERGLDLVEAYNYVLDDDKVLLAYTNKRVQSLNAQIQGKDYLEVGDKVFSPTTQKHYHVVELIEEPDYIDCHYSDPLMLGSKYRTLENLISSELCQFALLEDDDGNVWQHAFTFGHYDYKVQKEDLEREAVKTNQAIETKYRGYKAAEWAKVNFQDKLARARSKAWRDCLSFKDYVICLDFPHAMTVYKSQGSTFKHAFVDTDDLAICAQRNFEMYLKLAYVAISRASHYVGTN